MLCVLILKWLITKCCLCLSKVVRALFLINDAKVQKIFQTTKYFCHFFNQKAKIFWLSISYPMSRNFIATKFTFSVQISTASSPAFSLHRTPHAATFAHCVPCTTYH